MPGNLNYWELQIKNGRNDQLYIDIAIGKSLCAFRLNVGRFLIEYRALLTEFGALLTEFRALLIEYRALLIEYGAVVTNYRALLIEYMGGFDGKLAQ